MISGRIPSEVETAIRKLMVGYAGNITSVLCQFPSQQVNCCLKFLFVIIVMRVLKVICNDFLVVKVNCWSHVFNIIQPI